MKAVSAAVSTDQSTAVQELKTLRAKAERSAAEIGQELLRWQQSLGEGNFKKSFLLAGWTTDSVQHYIRVATNYQRPTAVSTRPEVVDDLYQPTENNTPPAEVSFPEDSPWQPKETMAPARLADLVNDGSLSEVCRTFMQLIPYEAMQAVYEVTKQQKKSDVAAQLEVLWWKIQIELYNQGE